MKLQAPLTVYCINLESAPERMEATREAFAGIEGVDLRRVPGVLGSTLSPERAEALMKDRYYPRLGTLGCFLAHAAAWQRIAEGDRPAVVIEDDVRPIAFERVFGLDIPPAIDLVFLNERMANRADGEGRLRLLHARTILPIKAQLAEHKGGVGGDGYLLTPAGARTMLSTVEEDGMGGHVDWRLLRYGIRRRDVTEDAQVADTWISNRTLKDRGMRWNRFHARRLTSALIGHRGGESIRRHVVRENGAESTED